MATSVEMQPHEVTAPPKILHDKMRVGCPELNDVRRTGSGGQQQRRLLANKQQEDEHGEEEEEREHGQGQGEEKLRGRRRGGRCRTGSVPLLVDLEVTNTEAVPLSEPVTVGGDGGRSGGADEAELSNAVAAVAQRFPPRFNAMQDGHLGICLHAHHYCGPDWEYEVDLPRWAQRQHSDGTGPAAAVAGPHAT